MDSELRQLQLKCLEIFDIVNRICEKHDILYSLCGGTVVGAHLYKAFLPWDDDIDIMMTRKNFNKFLKVAPQELPEGYSIVNYQNSDESTIWKICFTKIINDKTTIIQENGDIMGVFLDVDIYDKVPEGPLKYIDMFLCDRILTINKGVVEGNGLKNKLRNVFLKIVFPNRRKYLMFFQKVAEWLGQVPGRYTYRELFGAYHGYNKLPYEARIFENYTTIEFEGRRAMIVCDYIDYLQTRYNRTDFHEPKEKQIAPHYIYVNFNKPYKEFMREKNLSIPSMEDIK